MGEIVDGCVGIDTKLSPCQAAIEKAQAELRVEYDVREERRRELEFLEKGGDPLDFKFGRASSVSVQSTSHTNQHTPQNLTSEAKGSFALTASPHGDSVESSGRLGVTIAGEPNSADNFICEDKTLQCDRKSTRPVRSNITLLEHSSQLDKSQNVKDLEDSPIFHSKKGQSYRRRNRSRTNRDDPRSSSGDKASRGGHGSSMKSDDVHLMHSMTSKVTKFSEGKLNLSNSKEKLEELQNLSLKADEALIALRTVEPAIAVGRNSIGTLDIGRPSCLAAENTDYIFNSAQLIETSKVDGDDKCPPTDALTNNALGTVKGIDSDSSFSQANGNVDGNENIGSDLCTNLKVVDGNDEISVSKDNQLPIEDLAANAIGTTSCIKEDMSSICHQGNRSIEHDHTEVDRSKSSMQDKDKGVSCVQGREKHECTEIISEKERGQFDDCSTELESSCPVRPRASDEDKMDGYSGQPPVLETLPCTGTQSKPLDKAQEDKILEEARMIVAKRKRIAALSIGLFPREHQQKCHWDLVVEEMAWLANDFAQERLWKMTAAAQICRRVAFASRMRLEGQSKYSNQKIVAHTLAKAVMEFWCSAKVSVESADSSQFEKCKLEASAGINEMNKASQDVLQSTEWKQDHAVYSYAARFLQFNCSLKPHVEVEVPGITDVAFDIGLPELSWQDQLTEENLFYAVPPGAMEIYRKSIESCLWKCERVGNNNREEVVTPAHNAAADNGYEEDEGENSYYQPGALDAGKPPIKKLKIKSYKSGGDFGYEDFAVTRNADPQLNVMVTSPANNLHVDPIPMKRMRTASRQRIVGPFGGGHVGGSPVLSRADASSEDTNSFQDERSTPRGGSGVPTGLEVDSAMNFEEQSTFDYAEKSAKPKKKKKAKHEKDLVRKRSDSHQLESNVNGGLFVQHAKKPKLAKYSLDNSFDNMAPMSGSVASPVASQMSNMSSQAKLIKFIGGRDRGKKGKGLKVSAGQLGSGSPWTIVEDQALVVLVHDMGPNWELVSDAINSILQFKCIFRKPQECKERHKFLMDRPSGDGADSGDDSGSSQPYPSTLPGIPKGSARQLFQSLHAHVEEDNIKSRFEMIIRIEQQLYFRKKKNDNQHLKQIAPAHGSHVLSLSQVIPNNVNGGVLTPHDLSDTATSNQDSPIGGSPLSNQTCIPPINSPSGITSSVQSLQGSPSMGSGNNLASPPSQFNGARDAKYSAPGSGSGSLPIEEHQRLHKHNSVLPGRNVQASNLSSSGSPSGSDRGARIRPGGIGVGMMPGVNRNIPMARPGVQGSPSGSNMGGMPNNMNVHSGIASGRGNGNTMFRPRDSLHGVRSGQSSEHPRQMALPGMQLQPTQSNSVGAPPFVDLSPGFSNNQATSPLQTYPGHHRPLVLNSPHSHLSTSNHGVTPEQQAYIHMSRERQMHKLLPRQHPSSSLLTHAQAPSQIPVSSPSSSPMSHVGTVPHQQQKNGQVLGRSAQSRPQGQGQAQQYQQSGRQHPQQRRQAPKLMKGIVRGNMVIQQNPPSDSSHLTGLNSACQSAEEGDPAVQLIERPSLNSSSLPAKPLVSPSTSSLSHPQKPYVNQGKALPSTQSPSSTVLLSRNRQQLHGQPSLKMVNQSQPVLQRISQQNRQMNSDSLTKSKVDLPLTEQRSSSIGPPSACIDTTCNVMNPESVCDSSINSASLSVPSTSQAVTNSSGIEPFSSLSQDKHLSSNNNLVSHELEAQRQQQESQLPQKQSQIQDGHTGTTSSRLD